MSVLRPADISRFIAAGGRGVSIVLVHGADEGLVRSRVRDLATAVLGPSGDALSLVELEADGLQQDPARLLDEANAIGMFGGKRVILVRNAGKLPKAGWQPVLEVPPLDSVVIFQADDLGKTAPLRVAVEASAHAVAIPCYPPSVAEIHAQLDSTLGAAGLTLTPVARAYLGELLGADHALSESELAKLVLYCQGKLAIDVADIDAIITDTSANAGTEPIDRAFEGRLEEVEAIALRSFREGINPSGLLVLALNHALMLRRLAAARLSNAFDAALRQERIFFRRQDRIRDQAGRWDLAMANRGLESLAAAQDQARRNPSLEETIAVRALWSIALASRRR